MLATLERARHPASSPSRLSRRGRDRCERSESRRGLQLAGRRLRRGLECRKSLQAPGLCCVRRRDGGGEKIFEQISNSTSTVLYLHHDQQGSTRLLTGSTGKTEATFTYDAYGNKTGSTGTSTSPMGYDSQYTNADTGLIYLRAREYDPATGQFMSVDPKIESTQEAYAYAANDPVALGDPGGMAPNVACRTVNSPCGEQEAREELERRRTKHTEAEFEGAFATVLRYFNIPTPARDVGYDLEPVQNRNGITIREPGTTGEANTIRIMFGDKANPNGSAVIYDEYGKPIDYRTGKVPATRADWHIPGGNKVPVQGLPPWWRGE